LPALPTSLKCSSFLIIAQLSCLISNQASLKHQHIILHFA
jgi:hypothetical protein